MDLSSLKRISSSKSSSLLKWLELIVLFFILPLVVWQFNYLLSDWLLPLLTIIGALCLLLLVKDHKFKRFRLTNRLGFNKRITKTLLLFFGVMAMSTFAYALIAPNDIFALPSNLPTIWLLLLISYPLFSALPQEVIYRTFFFHRYKRIIPNKTHRILLSSTSFGFAHIIYGNWVAVVLSAMAGFCFSQTYAASRSTMLVVLEHSLWGAWLFTLGLGKYFDLSQQALIT